MVRTYTIDPWELPSSGTITDGETEAYPMFTALVGDTVIWIYGDNGNEQRCLASSKWHL